MLSFPAKENTASRRYFFHIRVPCGPLFVPVSMCVYVIQINCFCCRFGSAVFRRHRQAQAPVDVRSYHLRKDLYLSICGPIEFTYGEKGYTYEIYISKKTDEKNILSRIHLVESQHATLSLDSLINKQ